jgi:hypothetical protein
LLQVTVTEVHPQGISFSIYDLEQYPSSVNVGAIIVARIIVIDINPKYAMCKLDTAAILLF